MILETESKISSALVILIFITALIINNILLLKMMFKTIKQFPPIQRMRLQMQINKYCLTLKSFLYSQ